MPSLKASERRLLVIFGLLIFFAANFFLYKEVVLRRATLVQEEIQLEGRVFQLETLLTERPKWTEIQGWVRGNLPAYATIDDRDTYLITLVRNAATASGVEVVAPPQPIPSDQGGFVEETIVSVTVEGEIRPVVEWLYRLQDPSEFRTITGLKMYPAKKESSVVRLEITLAQWWSLESGAIATTTPETAPPGPAAQRSPAPQPIPETAAEASPADASPDVSPAETATTVGAEAPVSTTNETEQGGADVVQSGEGEAPTKP